MAGRRLVSVRILGHEYRIRTDSDPAGLERVAKLVDETMTRLRDRTGAVDSLDLAIMAALTLARDLVTERANRSEVALESDRISILVERIEACLAEQPEREHP